MLLRLLGVGLAYGFGFMFVKSLFPEPFVLLIMQGGGSSEGDLTTLALVYMGVGLLAGLLAAPIFGGAKNSGYGRELSHFGIHEFMNPKTVWVDESEAEASTAPAE